MSGLTVMLATAALGLSIAGAACCTAPSIIVTGRDGRPRRIVSKRAGRIGAGVCLVLSALCLTLAILEAARLP